MLAKEKISGRNVAIKKLNITHKERQISIIHETRILSSFYHPNIITYHHAFEADSQIHLVMEYCDGGTLQSKIQTSPCTTQEAISIVLMIANAINVVHEKNIIHHDIKPANILLTSQGVVKVGDFGIANTGGGTRFYMPPEAFSKNINNEDGRRIDVYALGVTFIELLTGKNPFRLSNVTELIEVHKQKLYGIEYLPVWLREVVEKAVNPDALERYQNMASFCLDLEQRNIPNVITRKVIESGKVAEKIEKHIKRRNWGLAKGSIEYAMDKLSSHPQILFQAGKYYQLNNNLIQAKKLFEVIKKKTTLINLDKELGWIYLQEERYAEATRLFSEYIQLSPADAEAYNLLLECYYRSGQLDLGLELSKVMYKNFPKHTCFKLNYALFHMLLKHKKPKSLLTHISKHPVFVYNQSVFTEKQSTYSSTGRPDIKTKLFFSDYNLIEGFNSNEYLEIKLNGESVFLGPQMIIAIGRSGFSCNDIELTGNMVSRRHCLIFNAMKNVWVYDLNSFCGTYIDDEKINRKTLIHGKARLVIGENELIIKSDKRKLL